MFSSDERHIQRNIFCFFYWRCTIVVRYFLRFIWNQFSKRWNGVDSKSERCFQNDVGRFQYSDCSFLFGTHNRTLSWSNYLQISCVIMHWYWLTWLKCFKQVKQSVIFPTLKKIINYLKYTLLVTVFKMCRLLSFWMNGLRKTIDSPWRLCWLLWNRCQIRNEISQSLSNKRCCES